MLRIIMQRVVGAVPVILLVTLITFGLMRLVPGDPVAAMTGLNATPQEREQI
ncbi:MAG: ABC transporter permease, partial [Alphaproteobacteria bacterium]|nr:ABC transporter permease [Alphaproteobacteria bacterium]